MLPMTPIEKQQFTNKVFLPASKVTPASHIIAGYITFEKMPDVVRLRRILVEQLGKFSRLSSVGDLHGNWTPVEKLDANYHVVEEVVYDINKRKQELLEQDLDLLKPLWRCHLLVTPNRDEHCFVGRIHHCVADGFRLAKVLQAIAETKNGEPSDFATEVQAKFSRRFSFYEKARLVLSIIPSLCVIGSKTLLGYESEFFGHSSLQHRKENTPFTRRILTHLPPLPLQEVKDVKNSCGGTVNDVLFLLMAGTYRCYAASKGDPLIKNEVTRMTARSLVPVALPDLPQWKEWNPDVLGNRFAFASVDIPLQYPSIGNRLKAVKETFKYMKTSALTTVMYSVTEFMGRWLPLKFTQTTASDVFARHTNVFSNVPGPQDAIYIAGEKVETISASFCNLITQFLLLSYNGQIYGTLVADPDVLEPNLFVDKFTEEWEALKQHYLDRPGGAID